MAFKVIQSSLVLILLMVVIFIFFLRNKLLNHDILLRSLYLAVVCIVFTERVGVLKSEFGTKPQAFYIGLDEEVR